ncbi:MAG TPA: hypothetical protein VI072_33940 [Polyangiaceae bacterium]
MLSDLIPESRLPFDQRNVLVAITLHELGNGWALPGAGMPPWLSSEDIAASCARPQSSV